MHIVSMNGSVLNVFPKLASYCASCFSCQRPANLYRFIWNHTFTGPVTRKCGTQFRRGPTTSTHQEVQICSLPVKAAPSKPAPAGAPEQMLNGLKGCCYQ